MGLFWVLAVAMALFAVGFVVWPLWSGRQEAGVDRQELVLDLFNEHLIALEKQLQSEEIDQQQFVQLRDELEQSLLEDAGEAEHQVNAGTSGYRWLWLAGLILPVASVLMYVERGSIDDVEIVESRMAYFHQASMGEAGDGESTPLALEELVIKLEERLDVKPDNAGNRYLLARSYMQMSQYMKAAASYMELIALEEAKQQSGESSRVPANIVGELAQAVFLAAGNSVTPEVQQLIDKALSIDPNETSSLGLAGIAAFEQGRYSDAIDYWGRAVQLLGPASNASMSLRSGMARAQELLAQQGGAPVVPESQSEVPKVDAAEQGGDEASIVVRVALSEGVAAAEGDTVFVYARAWQGPKVPLAIQRLSVAQLPAEIELNESMAMAPGMTLSSFPQLELVARVSPDGNPIAQPGDWQGAVGPIRLAEVESSIAVIIADQLP
ncbi:MAG: c-type cytochrome biogenesis protein CcmI [Cellvibrionaceae bacterium]|nr:c-type cytochrome biogenesis protein CcmI [Cellvibrionaceae bacterium]|tara:strand:- start:41815 stop:43131 length:1317 start_codon:yes stop_codon:yes gene_type:complete